MKPHEMMLMEKTTTTVLIALLAVAGLLLAAPALGQMGGGMMGGMGGGHCPMMGGTSYGSPGAPARSAPVTAAEAQGLAGDYIGTAGLELTVTGVKERRAVFEVETAEPDGTPSISVFVSRTTGAVWPEMGPQAMGGV